MGVGTLRQYHKRIEPPAAIKIAPEVVIKAKVADAPKEIVAKVPAVAKNKALNVI